MIVKDVTRLAKELDKACRKGKEVIGVTLDYVGSNPGVMVHIDSGAFARRFKDYSVTMIPYSDYPVKATAVIDGITYTALFTELENKKYGINANGTEETEDE